MDNLLAVLCIIGGGVQFYQPVVIFSFLALLAIAAPWAAWLWLRGERPPLLVPGLMIIAGLVLTSAANPGPEAGGRLLLGLAGLSTMVLGHKYGSRDFTGHYLGLPALGLWAASWDNSNILGFWVALAGLGAIYRRYWLLAAVYGAGLGIMGSRGAILALAAGGLALLPRRWRSGLVLLIPGLVLLPILIWWQPRTSFYRLHYWQSALSAAVQSPLVGLGPGSLQARQVIPESGRAGDYQLHAHNILFTTAAEQGLTGLTCLGLAAAWLLAYWRRLSIPPWPAALFQAVLVHSLVDEPLFWPGPLLMAAWIAGGYNRDCR